MHLIGLLTGRIVNVYTGAHEDSNDRIEFVGGLFNNGFMQDPNIIPQMDVLNDNLANGLRLTLVPLHWFLIPSYDDEEHP